MVRYKITTSKCLRFHPSLMNALKFSLHFRERGGGGGGGGTRVQRGAALALHISRKKGSFLRPPQVRDFVKEGYFFVPRYEVWGVRIPLQSTKYIRLGCRVTPEVTRLPSLLPLNRQRIIKSKVKISVPVHPISVF